MKTDKKIEEILEAYTNYGFGENLDNVIEMEFKMNTPTGKVGKYIGYPSLVKELSTLIQAERKDAYQDGLQANQMVDWMPSKVSRKEYENKIRKEAIEGFVNYAVVEAKKHQGNMFDGFMFDKAKEYIESEGK